VFMCVCIAFETKNCNPFVMVCSMIKELQQLYIMLNHNPYDDFEAPPISPPERFFFDWAPKQLEGAFEQQQQRDSAAEKVAPSERVTEVEGNEDVLRTFCKVCNHITP